MWEEFQLQIVKPVVWVKLAFTVLLAYALYRFGRTLLRLLEPHVDARLITALKWLWLLTVLVCWLGVATYAAYLSTVPILFDFGQDIMSGLRATSGQAIVILALAMIAWNLVGAVSQRIVPEDEFNSRTVRIQTLKDVVESTLKTVIVVVSLIAGLQTLGVNAGGLLAGVSVLGVAVGFGAQSLVKDMFTGFFILLEGQYGVGDVVTINSGPLSGTVENLTLRVTRLRALDGTVHIIPNGQISTVSVSSKDWSQVVATVEVTYNASINSALKVMQAVCDQLYTDPDWKDFFLDKPDVQGVTQLAADGVVLRALMKVLPKTQYALGREFNRRIKIAMDEAGIDLPSPQRSISFGGGPLEIRVLAAENPLAAPARAEANASQQRQPTPLAHGPVTPSPVAPSLSRDPEEGEIGGAGDRK